MSKKIKWITLQDMLENHGKKPEPDLKEFNDYVDINTLSDDQDDSVYELYQTIKSMKNLFINILEAQKNKNKEEMFINSLRVAFTKVNKTAIFNPTYDDEIAEVIKMSKKELKHYKRITKYRDPVENI